MSLYGQAVYSVILGVGSDKPNKQRSFVEENHSDNSVLVAANVENESVITHIINVIKRLFHIGQRTPVGLPGFVVPFTKE